MSGMAPNEVRERLEAVAEALAEQRRAFEAQWYEQQKRLFPTLAPLPAQSARDSNNRPMLADMLTAEAQALSALAILHASHG